MPHPATSTPRQAAMWTGAGARGAVAATAAVAVMVAVEDDAEGAVHGEVAAAAGSLLWERRSGVSFDDSHHKGPTYSRAFDCGSSRCDPRSSSLCTAAIGLVEARPQTSRAQPRPKHKQYAFFAMHWACF